MKKLLLIALITMTMQSFSQKKLSAIDTLTYSEMINKSNNKLFKTGMDIGVYYAIDKNSYKVGDTLMLGNPSGINTTSTFGGQDTRFEYLFYGKPAGTLLKGIRYVEGTYRNYKVTIEQIQFNKGSMGLENYVFFYVKPLPNTDFTIIDEFITITMVDTAIDRSEIYPLYIDRPMTRDDAIAFLKTKKEELDLQIITQEQYDEIKKKLMPIINQ